MRVAQGLLLASVLVLPTVLAGCVSVQTAKDWWDGNGGFVVNVGTLPATANGQRLGDFSTVKLAVTYILARPVGEIAPYAGVQYNPPYGLDLVARFEEGKGKPLINRTILPAKTIEMVDLSFVFVEAKLKNGTNVPLCPRTGPAEIKPCIAIPPDGIMTLDKRHNPPRMERTKTLTMEFPIVVVFNAEKNEYFLQSRSADEEAPTRLE